MLQSVRYLGLDTPAQLLNFRLALLGWMLTSNDHSFHEIMGVSKTYGLPYVPGEHGYDQVAPLAQGQLRINACLFPAYLHLFPDEVAYYRAIQDDHSQLMSPFKASLNAKAAWSNLAQTETGHAALAYGQEGMPFLSRSMTAYTAIPVSFINMYLKRPTTARAEMAYHLSWSEGDAWVKKTARRIKGQFPGADGGSVHAEMARHTHFLQRAWAKLPIHVGVSWRGGGASSLYGVGDQFQIDEYWSSTKLAAPIPKAQGYAARTGDSVPMLFRIQGTTGRIVNSASINEQDDVRAGGVVPRLDEVLFQPGTRFNVTAVIPAGGLGGIYPVVDITEL
jgi:hypothetical protein